MIIILHDFGKFLLNITSMLFWKAGISVARNAEETVYLNLMTSPYLKVYFLLETGFLKNIKLVQ